MGVTLRVCPQGRRATGYTIASVLRCAPHCLRTLRMPHASRILMFYLILKPIFVLSCFALIIKYLQG
ncbi:MAG: hypothetical protein NZ455_08195 [Bacteroidia bacterium]|nr:hypothetical protein [Bacteroidia bacterium]MDW8346341.1 hypothetical protein [Bacteroidia bacterium]